MAKGGSRGTTLVPGSAAQSLLYQRVMDQSMPMGDKKLTAQETRLLADWIDDLAATPASGASAGNPEGPRPARHWAFEALQAPSVPEVRDPTKVQTPVDSFILSRLEKEGIEPAPAASARISLRRLFLSLIGLPPTPEELRSFLEDPSAESYDRWVDKLLSRPQYGERWARHWLDVARYAESNGYERDGTKPHAWRYRDYVIDAFNSDKPFDHFIREQLAGDEITGSNAESQIATTFLRLGTWDDEPAEKNWTATTSWTTCWARRPRLSWA